MKFLPIGSVVILKGPEQAKRMIIGYLPTKDNCVYDYLAVSFPVGMTLGAAVMGINCDSIESVYQKGYESSLFLRMQANLEKMEPELRKAP
jgi:hypothetical protein